MRALWLGLALLLTGCGPSRVEQLEAENQNLKDQVEQLQSKLNDIQEKADNLETASSGLQEQLGRFDGENWRDVVPDAQAAGTEVESAQQELSDAAGE